MMCNRAHTNPATEQSEWDNYTTSIWRTLEIEEKEKKKQQKQFYDKLD